ncbi:hypothetical protein [Paenisporosarcina indica]|uniref:hypothetical protein n=1 Tax=Paenisporosarcina indica TaxID=650093 RepID=UPI00094F6F20|nr:hypothetical protein [Paenisporosarcina indica]
MTHVFFILDNENFDELKEEIKSIFWMYHDMIHSYKGFGHNIDFERVNYEKFFLTEIDNESMNGYAREVQLVKKGSFVALCCEVNDMLDESRRNNDRVYQFIKELLSNQKIAPFEEEILSSMLLALEEKPSYEWYSLKYGEIFSVKLDEVYTKYVLEYFKDVYDKGNKT